MYNLLSKPDKIYWRKKYKLKYDVYFEKNEMNFNVLLKLQLIYSSLNKVYLIKLAYL